VTEKEGEKERERESIYFKGMSGALAPFSYLVYNIGPKSVSDEEKKISRMDTRTEHSAKASRMVVWMR
jgi:hypothetical protein